MILQLSSSSDVYAHARSEYYPESQTQVIMEYRLLIPRHNAY